MATFYDRALQYGGGVVDTFSPLGLGQASRVAFDKRLTPDEKISSLAENTLGGKVFLGPVEARKKLAETYAEELKKMGDVESTRPTYEVPQEVLDAAAAAKREYQSDRTYAEAVMGERAQQATSSAVAAARKFGNTGDVLGTINRAQQAENQVAQNIGIMSEQRKQQTFGNYLNTRMALAGERQKQWMYNQYQPFYDRLNRQRELQRAQTSMQIGAADQLFNVGVAAADLGMSAATAYVTGGGSLAFSGIGGGGQNYSVPKGSGYGNYYDESISSSGGFNPIV